MPKATERALAAEQILKSKGYTMTLSDASGNDHILGFHAVEDGTEYPVTAFFSGNAFSIQVEIESYDIDDFDNMAEAMNSIPYFRDVWAGAAFLINSKMDGLCYICAEADDEPSLSVMGVTRGYHLDDFGAAEFFYERLCQALTQTNAGSAIVKNALQDNNA